MSISLSLSSIPPGTPLHFFFLECVMEWEKVGGSGRYDRKGGIK
jgi:hypothetical protein